MTTPNASPTQPPHLDDNIDAELQKKLDELIEEEEGAQSKFKGWVGVLITLALVAMSLVHLYSAYGIVPAFTLRPLHVGIVLALVFLIFPIHKRFRDRIMWWDILIAGFALFAVYYRWSGGEEMLERNTNPNSTDILIGIGMILVVLEGLRRTNGWILLSITV
ncbi:MAG: C4-dicarboxylate ABC transporter permease, partial [Burkholderiaceae bacterium]